MHPYAPPHDQYIHAMCPQDAKSAIETPSSTINQYQKVSTCVPREGALGGDVSMKQKLLGITIIPQNM